MADDREDGLGAGDWLDVASGVAEKYEPGITAAARYVSWSNWGVAAMEASSPRISWTSFWAADDALKAAGPAVAKGLGVGGYAIETFELLGDLQSNKTGRKKAQRAGDVFISNGVGAVVGVLADP